MKAMLVLAVLVAGCTSPGSTFVRSGHSYAPTNADAVVVLDAIPEGAEIIGDVEGWARIGWFGTPGPVSVARRRAADIGADAIVVTGRGTDDQYHPLIGPYWVTAKATALRLAK